MTTAPDGFTRVTTVEATGSTNADLTRLADSEPEAWPHLSVLSARHQFAGRGRSGREWVVEPYTALTASIVLRPSLAPADLSWLPQVVCLAVVRALGDLGARARAKWPNDVVLDDAGEELEGWERMRKVSGSLVEATPSGAIVVGIGVDVAPGSAPVPWAVSLQEAGVDATPDDVLAAIGRHLPGLVARLEEASGDAASSGLADEVAAVTATLGKDISAALPDGSTLLGRAESLNADGGLVVRLQDGTTREIVSGDVTTVRLTL
ncbi:MAG: biotin--[acetyl-CoA-carboxylase] ligase [Actinomycetaceae bacterium]